MQRVRSERDRFVGFVVEGVENIPEEERLRGCASFVDDGLLQEGDHTRVGVRLNAIALPDEQNEP
jgi:dihydrolipoamide dehydrogenase